MSIEMSGRAFRQLGFLDKLKATGPAWMGAGLNVGGATVTNSVILAAATGYVYGWVFFFATMAAFLATFAAVRLTIVTGTNPVKLIKQRLHPAFAWTVGLAVIVSNSIFFVIQVALLGDVVATLLPGIPARVGAVLSILFAAVLIIVTTKQGNVKLQRTIKYMVYLLSTSFLLSLFIVDIDWSAMGTGMVGFQLPTEGTDVLLFTSVLGSAMALNVPFMQAYATRSSDYTTDDLSLFKFETIVVYLFLLFVQLAVLVVVASTLFVTSTTPTSAVDAAIALQPLAGRLSTILFAFGMFGAAMSTMIANTSVQAYILGDLFERDTNPQAIGFKGIQIGMLALGLVVPILGFNAYSVASWGGAFNSLFMPAGIAAWLVLSNRRRLMGSFTVSWQLNLGILFALVVSLVAAGRFLYITFT